LPGIPGEKDRRCHGKGQLLTCCVHDVRRTYGALAIVAGMETSSREARRIDHKSITTTANIYCHLCIGAADNTHAIEQLLKKA
jgi:hypothetical protein